MLRDACAHGSLGARTSPHFCLEDRWRALAPSTIGPASRQIPLLFSPCSRPQTRGFPLLLRAPVLRLCCGDGTSPPRQICVLSLHRSTLHREDERKAGRTAHRITLLGRTAGSGCRHRAQGHRQEASRSSGLLALREQAGCSPQAASTPAGRTGADRAREQSLPCMGTRKRACCSEGRRPA